MGITDVASGLNANYSLSSALSPMPVSAHDASRPGLSLDAAFWPRSFQAYLSDPLDQRPAGSAGKSGACKLTFAAESGKTHLQHSFVSHPFHLTRPWYLDPALPGMGGGLRPNTRRAG